MCYQTTCTCTCTVHSIKSYYYYLILLSAEILEEIEKLGFDKPTPIQVIITRDYYHCVHPTCTCTCILFVMQNVHTMHGYCTVHVLYTVHI